MKNILLSLSVVLTVLIFSSCTQGECCTCDTLGVRSTECEDTYDPADYNGITWEEFYESALQNGSCSCSAS